MTKTEMLQFGTRITWLRLSSGQATYSAMVVLHDKLDKENLSQRR